MLHHLVLCRRQILADDAFVSVCFGIVHDRVQREVFHASLQHAATHKPRIDKERLRIHLLEDNDTYQSGFSPNLSLSENEKQA